MFSSTKGILYDQNQYIIKDISNLIAKPIDNQFIKLFINPKYLVIGDIVLINKGNQIYADTMILECSNDFQATYAFDTHNLTKQEIETIDVPNL